MYRTHPDVADCAVVGVEDGDWGERVCIAIVPAPGSTTTPRRCGRGASNASCRPRFPAATFVEALPNTLGKTLKPEVKKLF